MVSGTNDRYLQKGVVLRSVYEQVEPNLIWMGYANKFKEDDASFIYSYNATNMSSDTKKKTPVLAEIGGLFPEMDMSRETVATGLTESRGFALRVPKKTMDSSSAPNFLMKCYDYAGFVLAEKINTDMLTAITGGATTPTWTPTAVWSDASATPVDDILTFCNAMLREGYPYKMTDFFVNQTGYLELQQYLLSVDITDMKQRMYGIPTINDDTISIPVVGSNVHRVMSGMTDGYLLGLDSIHKGLEWHYTIDPQYGQETVKYKTIENSVQVTKTVQNVGIHYDTWKENDTKDTMLQFWYDGLPVVTQAYAIGYDSGI